MTETLTESHGKFIWYELMTPDPKGATKFYASFLPWTANDPGIPGMDYMELKVGGSGIGGIMKMPAETMPRDIPPNWSGYVKVDDVDATAARFKREGGTVHRGPLDIPSIGRFAVVADPQGAAVLIFKPLRPNMPMPAPDAPGAVGWRELHTTDAVAAMGFYSKMFGWSKGEAMDMGPMGTYQIVNRAGAMMGGVFNSPAAAQHPFWLYYFNVASIDAAKTKVEASGGKVIHGPQQVPGGAWIIQCVDPQGAHFALVGAKG